MIKKEDFNNPPTIFSKKTDMIANRILVLQKDYKKVQHYYSKAIIEKELEDLLDEYVARTFKISKEDG